MTKPSETSAGLVEELRDAVIDWDGSPMPDEAQPRRIPTCGEIRQAADRLTAAEAARDQYAGLYAERCGMLAMAQTELKAAEAEIARLRAGLEDIKAHETPNGNATVRKMGSIARATIEGDRG